MSLVPFMFTGIYTTECNIQRESTIITSDYQSINKKTRTTWKRETSPVITTI